MTRGCGTRRVVGSGRWLAGCAPWQASHRSCRLWPPAAAAGGLAAAGRQASLLQPLLPSLPPLLPSFGPLRRTSCQGPLLDIRRTSRFSQLYAMRFSSGIRHTSYQGPLLGSTASQVVRTRERVAPPKLPLPSLPSPPTRHATLIRPHSNI